MSTAVGHARGMVTHIARLGGQVVDAAHNVLGEAERPLQTLGDTGAVRKRSDSTTGAARRRTSAFESLSDM